jgi:hypothetical protein
LSTFQELLQGLLQGRFDRQLSYQKAREQLEQEKQWIITVSFFQRRPGHPNNLCGIIPVPRFGRGIVGVIQVLRPISKASMARTGPRWLLLQELQVIANGPGWQ